MTLTTSRDDAGHLSTALGAIEGRVITPADPEYDAARVVMLGGVDPRPALIVRVASPSDVAAVIGLARREGIEFAVRSGGHSGAGHSTVDGGIVLDLRDLRELDLDVEGRTAWAGAGLTAGEVSIKLAEHGLALGFGDTASVGIGGITLGGGVGYLSRKHGLTIDSLLAAEIVTADGEVLLVDEEHHPDLFWAIRGGGGNFGVATRFRYQLHALASVVGGMLILPATPDVVAGFIAAAEAAPDELSTIANVMPAPPMPFLAEEHHGSLVVFAMLAWSGAVADADEVLAPFRTLAEPLVDMLQEMPYPQLFPPDDPDYHPTAVARTMYVDRIDRDVAATILDRLERSDASLRVAQLRALGGAIARVPIDATAYAHRASRIMVNLAAFYDGLDDRVAKTAWLEEFATAIRQEDEGAYVNFLGDEGEERVRAAYPGETWARLAAVKARYDPTNVFRRNQNVPPVTS